eukprot:NODE_2183_length_658_cov_164.064039_g1841_i0.p1 GENE.NODE_2183_length_658_cov_164.064039_g1841_i0~~NODE_2183_length_658_cov_164.064039_g1841_i0.p1  ORF type:complete len:122 (+),score=0.90 NODE_2183_length_658_cov_164.064039_g1841_i0:163-528(+)
MDAFKCRNTFGSTLEAFQKRLADFICPVGDPCSRQPRFADDPPSPATAVTASEQLSVRATLLNLKARREKICGELMGASQSISSMQRCVSCPQRPCSVAAGLQNELDRVPSPNSCAQCLSK